MNPFPITTALSCIRSNDPVLKGTEVYPVVGDNLTQGEYLRIVASLQGLKRHWNCLEKAFKTVEILERGIVVLGSLFITSGDYKSEYGYAFNPPLEFHAWVQDGKDIIDVALPGVIEKGLQERDEIGYFIVERNPLVMAGTPLPWTRYTAHQVYQ